MLPVMRISVTTSEGSNVQESESNQVTSKRVEGTPVAAAPETPERRMIAPPDNRDVR
jgi:hypothetical protein